MLGFPFVLDRTAHAASGRRRVAGRALLLCVCSLALPLSLHAAERAAPMSAEARAWLGQSCTPQGCAPPGASAGIPLGFASAVLVTVALARRRDRQRKHDDDR